MRAVAALTSGKNALCTQPVIMPTVARRVPRAGTRVPSLGARLIGGASDSIVRRCGGSLSSSPIRRSSLEIRAFWYSASGPRIAFSRRG